MKSKSATKQSKLYFEFQDKNIQKIIDVYKTPTSQEQEEEKKEIENFQKKF